MPLTLPPVPRVTRRKFLAGAVAGTAGALAGTSLVRWALSGSRRAPADPDRFALLSDTHIAADAGLFMRDVNPSDNLRRVCDELTRGNPAPSAVFVNGDLACQAGEAGDYAQFLQLLGPVREAGRPLHLALGNHDHRGRFWEAVPAEGNRPRPVEGRQVLVVKTARANWFVLDSLEQTNTIPGGLGEKQLAWLARELDAHADRPAIVLTHHPPNLGARGMGLADSAELLRVLLPRRQVKAHFFGHTHGWSVNQRDGLHVVNLPPTAYVFVKGKPNGWVNVQLSDGAAALELHTLDPAHPQAGEKHELKWR